MSVSAAKELEGADRPQRAEVVANSDGDPITYEVNLQRQQGATTAAVLGPNYLTLPSTLPTTRRTNKHEEELYNSEEEEKMPEVEEKRAPTPPEEEKRAPTPPEEEKKAPTPPRFPGEPSPEELLRLQKLHSEPGGLSHETDELNEIFKDCGYTEDNFWRNVEMFADEDDHTNDEDNIDTAYFFDETNEFFEDLKNQHWCGICRKWISGKSGNVRKHNYRHKTEKTCNVCGKRVQKRSFNGHMEKHVSAGEKPKAKKRRLVYNLSDQIRIVEQYNHVIAGVTDEEDLWSMRIAFRNSISIAENQLARFEETYRVHNAAAKKPTHKVMRGQSIGSGRLPDTLTESIISHLETVIDTHLEKIPGAFEQYDRITHREPRSFEALFGADIRAEEYQEQPVLLEETIGWYVQEDDDSPCDYSAE